MGRGALFNENITGYLKNHCTKHRLVCAHFAVFSTLMPNLDMICNISDIFDNGGKMMCRLLAVYAGKVLTTMAAMHGYCVMLEKIVFNDDGGLRKKNGRNERR